LRHGDIVLKRVEMSFAKRHNPHKPPASSVIIRIMNAPTYPVVRWHPANKLGRDLVVGDLHGCVDALRYLLKELAFDSTRDRLFSVGDLVDRGNDSMAAIELIDKPWFFPVLGNHEDALCAVATGRMQRHQWYAMGGAWSANVPDDQLIEIATRLSRLPLVRIIGDGPSRFNVLHAEFYGSDADLEVAHFPDDVRQQLLWGRTLALGAGKPARQRGLSLTYCGHTPMKAIRQIGSQVFIDTGAFTDEGRLTIVEAGTERRWSVKQGWASAEGARELALP
jgi:serine/threonine protein phosphatase 1